MPTAQPIPQGYRTVTPHLTLNRAARAIESYERAFGMREVIWSVPAGRSHTRNSRSAIP